MKKKTITSKSVWKPDRHNGDQIWKERSTVHTSVMVRCPHAVGHFVYSAFNNGPQQWVHLANFNTGKKTRAIFSQKFNNQRWTTKLDLLSGLLALWQAAAFRTVLCPDAFVELITQAWDCGVNSMTRVKYCSVSYWTPSDLITLRNSSLWAKINK